MAAEVAAAVTAEAVALEEADISGVVALEEARDSGVEASALG